MSELNSTFKLPISIPEHVFLEGEELPREVFFQWIWERFQYEGLVGVHEGTFLSEEAAQAGLETESWTVDSAEAPRERDWVGAQATAHAELYFSSLEDAQAAATVLGHIAGLNIQAPLEQKVEDWDAQWKAHFLGSPEGVVISPFWRVVPPWTERAPETTASGVSEIFLKINPGAGFGTGTHETTQLCLEALATRFGVGGLRGRRVLDFGSGSGILAIGAALLGATVDAIEIDELAIDNSRENAELNGVSGQIHYSRFLKDVPTDSPEQYDVVIANILRPVLLEHASTLCGVLKAASGGMVILSGLIESDVPEVQAKYQSLMPSRRVRVSSKNEWRSIQFE